MLRRLTVLVALIAGLVSLGAGPASATPAPDQAERDFLALLNVERANAHLAPLTPDLSLYPIAREWSESMARVDVLSHRPDLRAQVEARVTRDWQRIGENVGRGADVAGLHAAFMASPGHLANVLGDYNRVAIAVVVNGPTVWVTFNFLKGAPIAAPAAPPPPPNVPVTTARTIDEACPERLPRGTFADVPLADVHARPIDCVAWWEVAGGVAPATYAPAVMVNRAQMASFVARAIEAAGYVLPAQPADAFADDNGSVHELHINQLAAVGVVSGTTANHFAPGDLVTRAQMATFLVRAHDLVA